LTYGSGAAVTALSIAEITTVICLIVAFVLFLFLAIRFRHSEGGVLRSFKLQLSIAILVWIIGEAFAYTNYLAEWSMYVHTCSMALFALFLVYRVRATTGK
jgi:apolipoprotein N-acyltransferase